MCILKEQNRTETPDFFLIATLFLCIHIKPHVWITRRLFWMGLDWYLLWLNRRHGRSSTEHMHKETKHLLIITKTSRNQMLWPLFKLEHVWCDGKIYSPLNHCWLLRRPTAGCQTPAFSAEDELYVPLILTAICDWPGWVRPMQPLLLNLLRLC